MMRNKKSILIVDDDESTCNNQNTSLNRHSGAINNSLTGATELPSHLNYIYIDALETVKPESVGIIR